MSESTYQQQSVTQYLLGALSESETERLDELSVTDDEFAETLSMAEHDLIDAWVQGDLSDADRQRFSAGYLSRAPQRHRLLFAQLLQEWSAKNAAQESSSNSKSPTYGDWLSWLSGPRQVALRWGVLAAALILTVGTGLLLIHNLRLRSQLKQEQARREQIQRDEAQSQKQVESQRAANADTEPEIARQQEAPQPPVSTSPNAAATPSTGGRVVAFTLAAPLRDAGQIRTVPVPPDTSRLKIQLELEADLLIYQVQLLDSGGRQILWRSANLKPQTSAQRKIIELSLPASLVKSETYVLRVSGTSGTGTSEIVGDYSFRIVR